MKEVAIRLGPSAHLSGTAVLPDVEVRRPIAAILYNAGVIPRMGPRRFNVYLSRALCRRGIAGIRLDLSRLGDSSAPSSDHRGASQADADLRSAIDFVDKVLGIERVLLFGICSGAVQAMEVASKDERVVGIWLVDPPAYPTWRTFRTRYAADFRDAPFRTLARAAWHQLRAAKSALARRLRLAATTMADVDYGSPTVTKMQFSATMRILVERGVKVYIVYTATRLWDYNYAEQFEETFAPESFIRSVRCELRPEINHVFTSLSMRQVMLPQLVQWADDCLSVHQQSTHQSIGSSDPEAGRPG